MQGPRFPENISFYSSTHHFIMDQNIKIGFIGLGRLGTPIARNLVDAGYDISVYNRTASKSIPLQEAGARVAPDIGTLAGESAIVFTILSDDAVLKKVVDEGLLQHLKPGAIHISMSTILPATAGHLAKLHTQHNQHYLAAPVFGRPEAASAKKLNFVISGEQSIRTRCTPLLKDAGAANVWDFGDLVESANTIKLCGNFMIGAALEAMGETIGLARKSGIDPQQMWDMFTQTLFPAPIYLNYGNIILKEKFEPAAFTAKLGLKDINLVLNQAGSVGQKMPLADLLKNNLQELLKEGKEDIDWSAVFLGAQNN